MDEQITPKADLDTAKRFTLVVMQSTSLCNLNCRYCYVPDRKNAAVMSPETLDATYHLTVGDEERLGITHEFLWHAGEPLSVGTPYMQDAVERCTTIAAPDAKFRFTMQTNGVLLTPKWATFLADWDFSVGVSIDGPAILHNANRVNWAGRDSLDQARRGLDNLMNAGCRAGVLAVLTHDSLDYPDEIFDYFLKSGVPGLGFNIEEIENQNTTTTFDADRNGEGIDHQKRLRAFFDRLFELWWPHRQDMQIREFVDIQRSAAAFRTDPSFARSPDEARPLGIVTVIRNGDVTTFSPEFAGATSDRYKDFIVGNVHTLKSLNEVLDTQVFKDLNADINQGLKACVETCAYHPVCGSAFISNRFFEHGDFTQAETFTCLSMRKTVADALFDGLLRVSSNA